MSSIFINLNATIFLFFQSAVFIRFMRPTFYFFDYETFGIDPSYDRPAQFAGVRTDANFNIIDEPLVLYCHPSQDYLPNPLSCLITGITPDIAEKKGIPEHVFIKKIMRAFRQPNTCLLGYNNIRFDDEFTRYCLYRNLYDAYAHEWENGNSRWDLLDVTRAFYALRPDGIDWPIDEQGAPCFKLEALCAHDQAHDALADVKALISLAKQLQLAQPKLFHYLWQNRTKKQIKALLNKYQDRPLVHVSGMFPATQGCVSWIYPIAPHPTNTNAIITIDLSKDCTALMSLDANDIKQALFTPQSEKTADHPLIPIKLVHINKCPILAPANALSQERALIFHLDRQDCFSRYKQLKSQQNLADKLIEVFRLNQQEQNFENKDPEQALYQGFFSPRDKKQMIKLHNMSPEALVAYQPKFEDPRLATLFERYKARYYFSLLSEQEQLSWQTYCQIKMTEQQPVFLERLETLSHEVRDNPEKIKILERLYQHYAN